MSTDILVLTGPESCGKSTLAQKLSEHFDAPLVQEASRDYLSNQSSYQEADLLHIAKQQLEIEQAALSGAPDKLICDTDLLVIIIWSEVKYGRCDAWIINAFEQSQQAASTKRHYLLCDYHVPWQPDPLRENPDNRDELFELYLTKLNHYDLNYTIVKGDPDERLRQVAATFV